VERVQEIEGDGAIDCVQAYWRQNAIRMRTIRPCTERDATSHSRSHRRRSFSRHPMAPRSCLTLFRWRPAVYSREWRPCSLLEPMLPDKSSYAKAVAFGGRVNVPRAICGASRRAKHRRARQATADARHLEAADITSLHVRIERSTSPESGRCPLTFVSNEKAIVFTGPDSLGTINGLSAKSPYITSSAMR